MHRSTRAFLCAALTSLVLLLSPAGAHAVTIGFDDLAAPPSTGDYIHSEQGFDVNLGASPESYWQPRFDSGNPSPSVARAVPEPEPGSPPFGAVIIVLAEGRLFVLESIDVRVEGLDSAFTVLGLDLAFNDLFNLPPIAVSASPDFQRLLFPDTAIAALFVTFGVEAVGRTWSVDNIVVDLAASEVPEPTGTALLIVGLVALVAASRRKDSPTGAMQSFDFRRRGAGPRVRHRHPSAAT